MEVFVLVDDRHELDSCFIHICEVYSKYPLEPDLVTLVLPLVSLNLPAALKQ